MVLASGLSHEVSIKQRGGLQSSELLSGVPYKLTDVAISRFQFLTTRASLKAAQVIAGGFPPERVMTERERERGHCGSHRAFYDLASEVVY